MTAKGKRLHALEARQAARQARERAHEDPAHGALVEEALRVLYALPGDLQAQVVARGARGTAELLEAWWEVDRGEDLAVSARAAYALAFEGARVKPDRNPAEGLRRHLQTQVPHQPPPTREDVLAGLLREARGEGPGTSSAARVTAWRLIGEHLGLWQPEKDTGGKSGLEKLVEEWGARREQRNRERGLEE